MITSAGNLNTSEFWSILFNLTRLLIIGEAVVISAEAVAADIVNAVSLVIADTTRVNVSPVLSVNWIKSPVINSVVNFVFWPTAVVSLLPKVIVPDNNLKLSSLVSTALEDKTVSAVNTGLPAWETCLTSAIV